MTELERALRTASRWGGSEAAARRLVARAREEGLIDVAYGVVDSPLGPLTAAVTPRGLVRLAYGDEDDVLEDLAARLSPRVLDDPVATGQARRELEEYFGGHRARFEVPIDWTLSGGFTRKVLRATARIPFGSVSTYTDVAGRAGNRRAYRAAGNALGSNPIPIVVPCHRVLHKDGGLGGYTGGLDRKEFLLRLEGALGE